MSAANPREGHDGLGRLQMPWAIVDIANQALAIQTQDLHQIVILPEVNAVPDMPPHVRGVINVRGRVFPLTDLRVLLGKASAAEEAASLSALLAAREQDHRNWIAELEASVRENREFKLATDPHECAFGRWFDTFETDNLLLSSFLKKFVAPHDTIHAVAAEVLTLNAAGDREASLRTIEAARNGVLQVLLSLFEKLQELLRETRREVGLLFEHNGNPRAIAVDRILAIERLEESAIECLSEEAVGLSARNLAYRVAKRAKEGQLVVLLEADQLLATA